MAMKSEVASFRLERRNLIELRNEVKAKSISLNSFVNQIFTDYVDWHSNASKAGMVCFPKSFLINLMSKLSEKEVIVIAENMAENEMKEILLMLRKKSEPIRFIDLIKCWMKASDFPFRHENNDGLHEFIIQHDMGKNCSIYLGWLFKFVFGKFRISEFNFDVTPNTLTFNVNIGKSSNF